MNKIELLNETKNIIERLEGAQRCLGFHTEKDVKAFIMQTKFFQQEGTQVLLEFEDGTGKDQRMNIANTVTLCLDKTRDLTNHNHDAENAMKEAEQGEETEFCPHQMQFECDEMETELLELLKNVNTAIDKRLAKLN